MIQLRTMLKAADNTGANVVQCIRVFPGFYKRYARIGDVITAVVKDAEPRRLVKKHDIVRAVVVRQKAPYKRADGSFIRFDENAAVILEAGKEPKGGRVFGPIPREIREKGFTTIANVAPELL